MRSYLSILILLMGLSSFSQKKEFNLHKKYSVKQVYDDINYTEKHLTKFHPDPYRYITKDSLHDFVNHLKASIDTPLTEMQIRFYIKKIISKIGCGHTDVGASKKYTKALKTFNRAILPLNTFITDSSQLYVFNNLSSDTAIKPGDEIVSIDNHSVKKILKTIYSVISSDGYNETYKKETIKYDWFKYYYSFCYGFKLEYLVKIKKANNVIITHKLPSISSLRDTLLLPKKDSITYLRKTKTCSYYHLKEDSAISVIDINAFKGLHWRRFFRKTFKDIEQRKTQNLVIDLRDNGGGKIFSGFKFLSYLIDETLILPFDRKPNLMLFNPKYKMDLASRLTPLIFSTVFPQWPKNGRMRHYFFTFKKKRHAFKGQVYVLINGRSFSMSCIAASYLKYKAKAKIIGEETGGNIAGSNAVIKGGFVLPHSNIRVFTPMYHIYHDIEIENLGFGIMPDYPTHYTKQNYLNGEDVDLKRVLEIIHQK